MTATGYGVVRQLTNRRLYQASARVLDVVSDEVALLRRATGDGPAGPLEMTGSDYDLALEDVATSAALQVSMRTMSGVRQRSLADFLS